MRSKFPMGFVSTPWVKDTEKKEKIIEAVKDFVTEFPSVVEMSFETNGYKVVIRKKD